MLHIDVTFSSSPLVFQVVMMHPVNLQTNKAQATVIQTFSVFQEGLN